MPHRLFFGILVIVQIVCAGFFLWNFLATTLGFALPGWQFHEFIEIGAAFGLLLGVVVSFVLFRQAYRRATRVEAQLRAASGAFMELLEERFDEWGLTPAERDVALFAIKGMSTAEIAGLRETSEGTVKAQTAAIYRKAGVSGRPQLLSLFIEDLVEPGTLPLG